MSFNYEGKKESDGMKHHVQSFFVFEFEHAFLSVCIYKKVVLFHGRNSLGKGKRISKASRG